jgi:methylenetetrahydrofolate reductase (NADH)
MMNQKNVASSPECRAEPSVVQAITQLARGASIEINVQDVKHLAASHAFVRPATKMYVSHLPKQTFDDTELVCVRIREAGFDPVPHIPVRLITDPALLERMLSGLVQRARVQEVLLIAGDYDQAVGPYLAVRDVLTSGVLERVGLRRVSVAGHPEGHPKVPLAQIRHAEREKVLLAQQRGLTVSLVTQFFFEHSPFVEWVEDLRSHGVQARVVGGLAGPARLAALFKYAIRCGAGPSIRALGVRPGSLMKLVGEHGPEHVLRGLAEACDPGPDWGIHLFCFGGFLRTCEWLHRVASGDFELDAHRGLRF